MKKTKKRPTQYDWLFSLGNSTVGPIGFCATVRSKNSKDALKKLKKAIEWFNSECDLAKATGVRGDHKDLIDLQVYFNTDYINQLDTIYGSPVKEGS